MSLLLAFRSSFIAAGLYGVQITGADTPAINGAWWYVGIVNTKPSYAIDGYLLWWEVSGSRWIITADGSVTALYAREADSLTGPYVVAGGTRELVVTTDPVYPYRHVGDVAQEVLTPFRCVRDPEIATRWTRYPIQIALYLPSPKPAEDFRVLHSLEMRAQACADYYAALGGSTNAAEGLTLSGWRARSVQVDQPGMVDARPITNGQLFQAIVDVHLLTVDPT